MFRQSSANRTLLAAVLALGAVFAGVASIAAQDSKSVAPAESNERLNATVQEMWAHADPEWKKRLQQDETQLLCSRFRNEPPEDVAASIRARELATIVYPKDGNYLGDWKEGEKIAQSGRGGQFSDAPDAARGGNCYACHEMAKTEMSFGSLGPSLAEYGKNHNFTAEATKETFAKLYNSQASFACSNMPRFGVHGFLSEQQIKDVLAYLFDPKSPVNK
ncbi:sulfur oxidation c-type cytochrome SoxX [Hyphomicrobium methylovorum]|nr:sulfur oxidation c-type cytochrome SoxX [Hyphomicrobium methylovorum]